MLFASCIWFISCTASHLFKHQLWRDTVNLPSDICSIFHMVSTFHCIASNLLKCLLLSLLIIVLIISWRPVFRTYYILLSCCCLTSKFSSSVSCINLFWRTKLLFVFCRLDFTWHRERGRNTEWQGTVLVLRTQGNGSESKFMQILLVLMVQ